MKKYTRIAAIIGAICLVCGTAVLTVSAALDSRLREEVKKTKDGILSDIQGSLEAFPSVLEDMSYGTLEWEGDEAALLNDTAVVFTDDDESSVVLTTSLEHDARVRVLAEVKITNQNAGAMRLRGFCLAYKTEDGQEMEVTDYQTNESAGGLYMWQNHFNKELVLPAGSNELIFTNRVGENYEITLNIQVLNADEMDIP
ncbi:hypothetical protein AALB16_10230 [Lachnospiraceae bacterium 62-35]